MAHPVNVPDIVGAGAAAAQISATAVSAKWIQFVVTGAGTARIGDSTTDATHGIPIAAGYSQFFPPLATAHERYALDKIYYYVPAGATLSITRME